MYQQYQKKLNNIISKLFTVKNKRIPKLTNVFHILFKIGNIHNYVN